MCEGYIYIISRVFWKPSAIVDRYKSHVLWCVFCVVIKLKVRGAGVNDCQQLIKDLSGLNEDVCKYVIAFWFLSRDELSNVNAILWLLSYVGFSFSKYRNP